MTSVLTALCHKFNAVCISAASISVSVLAIDRDTPMLKSATCTVPALADGVRYILVVTRQAVETAAGRILDDLEFHAWVVENDERIRTIGDHVRPKPTAKGARVYIKIHHFT